MFFSAFFPKKEPAFSGFFPPFLVVIFSPRFFPPGFFPPRSGWKSRPKRIKQNHRRTSQRFSLMYSLQVAAHLNINCSFQTSHLTGSLKSGKGALSCIRRNTRKPLIEHKPCPSLTSLMVVLHLAEAKMFFFLQRSTAEDLPSTSFFTRLSVSR